MAAIDRSFGRQAFGLNPAAYHAARPEYPDWVYDRLVRCGLRPGVRVFEIGAGTGKATRRLIERGADPLVAVEPDGQGAAGGPPAQGYPRYARRGGREARSTHRNGL